jgi:DNA-binding SARP family transcriptional activator
MSFEVRLLGCVELDRDGTKLPLGPAKRRALLAALALDANRPVSLDRLTGSLWAGRAPDSAVANLRTHVAELRRHLGDRLVARPRAYLLRLEDGELDADRFTALAERGRTALHAGDPATALSCLAAALGIWRGQAGQDLPADSPLHGRFAVLDHGRLAVFEDYVQARMALDPHADVVPDLRRHLGLAPLRERAWAQLMLALYRAGDVAAALAAYAEARTVLREDLGIEPGPELGSLQRAILDRAPALSAPASRAGPAAPAYAPARVPRQLPPEQPTFVGREDEVAALESALRAAARGDGPPVIGVSGSGGVGKSAVALCAAHRAADAFPDGQAWIDLRGSQRRLSQLSAGEALGRVLRALGVPAGEVLPTTDERAAQYRALVAGRRLLVVADNALDAAHVRPLIVPGGGSALLVTSRRGLATVDGAVSIRVGPMADASALTLLGLLAGPGRVAAERREAHRLIRWCAGLPLTLRIVGARLASRPDRPLASLADKLADGPTVLDELTYEDLSMRTCLDAGYQPLTTGDEVGARAFRLLGTLPAGEVSPVSVARWLAVPVPAAERILERLVDAQLLEYLRPGRYRMPDLVHRYAAELGTVDDPPGARQAMRSRRRPEPRMPGHLPPTPVGHREAMGNT